MSSPGPSASRQDVPDGSLLVLGVPGVSREAGGGRGVTLTRRLPAPLVLRATEQVRPVPGPGVPDEGRAQPGGRARPGGGGVVAAVVVAAAPVHLVHRGLLAALEAAVVAVVVVEQRLASGGSAYHVPELADGAAETRVGVPGAPAFCRDDAAADANDDDEEEEEETRKKRYRGEG